MDPFNFNGRATIKHINPRKEGPDDEKVLAVDIKLNATVASTVWDHFHEDLRPVLYTDAGAAKNALMESIGFAHSVRNCTLTILKRTFHGVEAKNFKLRAKDGFLVDLTFSVTVEPDGNDIALFAEYLQDDVDVSVVPQPDLFTEDAAKGESRDSQLESDDDPMYPQAVEVVVSNRRASISSIQRHLRIGYNRAARLLEQMEGAGVVSAMQSNGHRDVLVSAQGAA